MIGATPARSTISICSTHVQRPAATPASIALPPRSRMRWAASDARQCPDATTPCIPITVGRYDPEIGNSLIAFPLYLQVSAAQWISRSSATVLYAKPQPTAREHTTPAAECESQYGIDVAYD